MPPVDQRSTPRLSIILIMLDEAASIRARLEALQPLRDQGAELIVVDGGSEDDSAHMAEPLADQLLVTSAGRAHQLNQGAAQARAGLLMFLHADTTLPGNAPQLVEQALSRHHWGRFDVHIEGHSPWLAVIARMINLRSRLSGIATGDQAMFMRHDCWKQVGGFPEQPLMEDIEMSRRLKRLSAPICLKARVTTDGRRWEHEGVFATIWLMWRLRWRYWRGISPAQLAREYRNVR
ncbi:TIGR04283 family arsenosugar biosynthesis glycosyltransferase [Halomonas cupida]|uniref:TIGR04283 family arsenosugar biosynthesis glycosyltransferase n=1 Tax=Halomonas cupida TaxID=44933 RepID=UPI003A8FE38C